MLQDHRRNHKGAAILAVGMVTAVGIGAKQTASSVRAGISRFCEVQVDDLNIETVVMATVPQNNVVGIGTGVEDLLDEDPFSIDHELRKLRLSVAALCEIADEVKNLEEIPVLLGMPVPLSGDFSVDQGAFFESLSRNSKIKFDLKRSQLFQSGRASDVVALKEALDRILLGKEHFLIVGGVDSWIDIDLLDQLIQERRLLNSGSLDGFIPGEGACFLLISSTAASAKFKAEPMTLIEGVGLGKEKGHRYSQEVYRGEGLSEAFQNLFASIDDSDCRIQTVFSGLNGESMVAKEWGVAYLRHRNRFEEDFRLHHPADCFGDMGAALGISMIGMAAIGIQKRYIKDPCMVWCSSDYADRGAVLLKRFIS